MKRKIKLLACMCLLFPALIVAQSPVNGFMKKQGEGALSLSYSQEMYDQVFLVPQEIDGVPVFNEVTTTSMSFYGEVGITDRLNVIVNIPYVKTEGEATQAVLDNNGFENTREDLQDLKIYAKYLFHTANFEKSSLNLMGAIGLETPLSDYPVDEGLQSIIAIGNQGSSFNMLALATFKTDFGLFATGQAGYSFRGNRVPDALLTELKIGYAGSRFYLDAFVANQLSDKEGVDILGEGFEGFFPATRVNFTRVGVNLYVPVVSGIGISGGASTYVAGRNIGKATGFYGGLVYSF